MSEPDLRRPVRVERAPVWLDGVPSQRLMVILRAPGCVWSRKAGGGCSNCGFAELSTHGAPVSAEELVAQFDAALAEAGPLDDVAEVDVYNSGSFFADEEIPAEARSRILSRLRPPTVRRVLVAARAEQVRAKDLAAARACLGEKELEVGIGLESADDRVRDKLINKGFGRAEFQRAVRILGEHGARLLVYVLVKPLGLSEREAIEDCVATARYVFEVAGRSHVQARIALEPVFVAPQTALEKEFVAGRYQPPSLWSVVEIVRRIHSLGELLVGQSDEGLSPQRIASGCARCDGELRRAFAAYNRTRDLSALSAVSCPDCRPSDTSRPPERC